MQMKLTGHHVDITKGLKDCVAAKMERIERHFDQVTDMHVILTVEKLRQKAEATINVSGGQIHAEAVHEDMYAAIDLLADRLDRQVKKHKEKMKDHHQREALRTKQP